MCVCDLVMLSMRTYSTVDPDHPYSYCPRTELFEDDEGYYSINWRTVGVDNDSGDDNEEEEEEGY